MFKFIADAVRAGARWAMKVFRKITGFGPDNMPDAISVFTIATRVAVVALGAMALIATIIPALSADPVAVRLLSASQSLWDAGTRAGYESRYGFRERERGFSGARGLGSADRAPVSVYDLDDDDDAPMPTWSRR